MQILITFFMYIFPATENTSVHPSGRYAPKGIFCLFLLPYFYMFHLNYDIINT